MNISTWIGSNVYNIHAYNLFNWSLKFKNLILKLFHRKDHHIKAQCRKQHLGCYLESQGHSMTLKQNVVRPITALFEVGFQIYFTIMITILRRCVSHNIWVATLKIKVTTWPCSKIVSGPYICVVFFKSDFTTVITEMITILGWHVAHTIWRDLEGQCHSMILQQKRVRPITLLFKVGYYNFLTEIITILRWCVTTLTIGWLYAY